ncbi:PDZ domain-containing protein [candidate division WOR-3 bacterium]|nr:PDZ domain-containing protein [candidate division WOR-3 bacterium]
MKSKIKGYYRYPTIHKDKIAFVAEDDLWLVSSKGGTAHRLTANLGEVSHPFFSPDGEWIAFIGREEGDIEVYLMPASGGPAKRLTYLGKSTLVVGWHGKKIIFASNTGQPFRSLLWLYEIGVEGNDPKKLPYGPARNISYGKNGIVIGRNTGDPARWKRYRGGTAGEIWIDEKGTGKFYQLIRLKGNLANPMWINNRIFFISDHKGICNIFSCNPNGKNLKQHTNHNEFYSRNATTDGNHIVYHNGADIYMFDPKENESRRINIEYCSPHVQRNRKFVDPSKYLEDYSPKMDGSAIALVSRGKSFTMGNWEGSVIQQRSDNDVRYRLTRWLNSGERVVLVSDEGEEDHLEIHLVDASKRPKKLFGLNIGRPMEMKVSPRKDEVVLTNHRNELIWVNLTKGRTKKIDQSKFSPIEGFDWAPDGNWIAYSFAINHRVSIIKIYETKTSKKYEVTEPILHDVEPVFDPQGRYLYFLSHRIFNPVYDNMHFDLNFPKGMHPYAITLQKDLPSPFVPRPHAFEKKEELFKKTLAHPKKVKIDFIGIKERIVPFPVEESIYESIAATNNRVFYMVYPVEGARGIPWFETEPPSKASLKYFDMKKLEEEIFLDRISNFKLSNDGTAVVCRIGNRLRVIRTMKESKEELTKETKPSRKTGWIGISRLKVSIDPVSEWQQMFREAWRLQQDYFWVEDMSGINWRKVFKRYYPLVTRVASRSEFSDLMWEMQGELGTSHAYELGGDYRPKPVYKLGFLGADLVYDPKHKAYRFTRIVSGDVWDEKNLPPLKRPGVNIREGMLLLAVGGKKVSKELTPNKLLVNQAGQEVQLTVANRNGGSPRTVCVKTIVDETPLRYRDWVENNRRYIHEKTKGRVGYVHIPDMSAEGYAEFHRYFLVELDYEGLIVDVRFNGGGHVSSLLLEKLARKRIAYDLTRWMGYTSYPEESVCGSIIALTNEYAGSDGDIFSHSFKLMKLGKLIGRRTWGGVIGIWPRNWLVDGTITTQPEFSFWFKDVGWGVENYGTDPDIEVDITPQEFAKGIDTQLERTIEEILKDIKKNPPLKPKFGKRPKRTLP